MSAPLLWILIPAALSAPLLVLRRWRRVMLAAAIAISLLLAWLAWELPIGEPITLGFWPGGLSFKLDDTLSVLGRRLILGNDARPLLILVYVAVAFWFGGAGLAHTHSFGTPLWLAVAALLVATLAVEPFLYGALLIELVALLCVPILSPPGRPLSQGVLRFLTIQTLGMPFILFTGWLLNGIDAHPGDMLLAWRTAMLLGLGFAFLSAVFPFHVWIPLVAEESNPYAAAFVFFVLPMSVSLFGMTFLVHYAWLRSLPLVYQALQVMGAVMVVSGGVWAAFQRHQGRIMGYATIVEIGLSLLAISLARIDTAPGPVSAIFFAQLLPRGLGLALWALALTILQQGCGGLRDRNLVGAAQRWPIAAATAILAQLSLAGMPLLAAFPVRLALWMALAQGSRLTMLLVLIGSGGLFFAGLRSLSLMMIGQSDQKWQVSESRLQILLLITGCVGLIVLGITPQWFLPAMIKIAGFITLPLR